MPSDQHTITLLTGIIALVITVGAIYIIFKIIERIFKEVGPALAKSLLFLGAIALALYMIFPSEVDGLLSSGSWKSQSSETPQERRHSDHYIPTRPAKTY